MSEYQGSIDLIGGLRPKNNGTFPLMEAKDIQVDNEGTRLDTALNNIASSVIITLAEYQALEEAGELKENVSYIVTLTQAEYDDLETDGAIVPSVVYLVS